MRLGPPLPGSRPSIVHPPGGRYGGQSVCDRNAARAQAAVQQQQQAPSTAADADDRCYCGALQLRYVEPALRGDAMIRDSTKCRAHQPQEQQQG